MIRYVDDWTLAGKARCKTSNRLAKDQCFFFGGETLQLGKFFNFFFKNEIKIYFNGHFKPFFEIIKLN